MKNSCLGISPEQSEPRQRSLEVCALAADPSPAVYCMPLFLWFLLGITLAVTFLLGYVRGCNAEITREYNRIHAECVASEIGHARLGGALAADPVACESEVSK